MTLCDVSTLRPNGSPKLFQLFLPYWLSKGKVVHHRKFPVPRALALSLSARGRILSDLVTKSRCPGEGALLGSLEAQLTLRLLNTASLTKGHQRVYTGETVKLKFAWDTLSLSAKNLQWFFILWGQLTFWLSREAVMFLPFSIAARNLWRDSRPGVDNLSCSPNL